jgi:hypothetical protein
MRECPFIHRKKISTNTCDQMNPLFLITLFTKVWESVGVPSHPINYSSMRKVLCSFSSLQILITCEKWIYLLLLLVIIQNDTIVHFLSWLVHIHTCKSLLLSFLLKNLIFQDVRTLIYRHIAYICYMIHRKPMYIHFLIHR